MARRTTSACAPRAPAGATCSPTTRSSCTPAAARSRGRRSICAHATWRFCSSAIRTTCEWCADYIAADPLRALREAALSEGARDAGPGSRRAARDPRSRRRHGDPRARADRRVARPMATLPRHRGRRPLADRGASRRRLRRDVRLRSPHAASRGATSSADLCATFGIALVHLHNISGCREGLHEALADARCAVRLYRSRSQLRVPDDHVPRRRRHLLRRRRPTRGVQRAASPRSRHSPASTSRSGAAGIGALLRRRGVPDRAVASGRPTRSSATFRIVRSTVIAHGRRDATPAVPATCARSRSMLPDDVPTSPCSARSVPTRARAGSSGSSRSRASAARACASC